MQSNIDKDVSLFFPEEFNYLLLGGNFLFSKRLYEIVKRQSKIRRVDYKHEFDSKYFPCIDDSTFEIHLESFKRIQASIYSYNSDTLIFTSEILLFLSQDNYTQFLSLLRDLAKLDVKLIFISVKNPLHVCKKADGMVELSSMASKTWYHDRVADVKSVINPNKDLVYEFSSYLTYTTSNLQTNPLELLNNQNSINICSDEDTDEFLIGLADDVVYDIISNSESTGEVSYEESRSKTINLMQIQQHLINEDLYNYVDTQSKCSLNLIYRKKPYEISNNSSVADWRYKLGQTLKSSIPNEVIAELDVIVPIPETGKYYAQGLSYELNKPYLEAFYKQSEVGRSFDIKDTKKRESFINSKLGVLPDLVHNKVIGIIDEAIFTGQTLKTVSNLLQTTTVSKVYLFIASPECKHRCKFNMQPDRELLFENKTLSDLRSYFKMDGVFFQDYDSYKSIVSSSGFGYVCCFTK